MPMPDFGRWVTPRVLESFEEPEWCVPVEALEYSILVGGAVKFRLPNPGISWMDFYELLDDETLAEQYKTPLAHARAELVRTIAHRGHEHYHQSERYKRLARVAQREHGGYR